MATTLKSTPEISKEDLGKLGHLSSLLHLFNHRNKNQHRRSVWWRHFSLFRRHLEQTVSDYQTLDETPTTHLERTRKRTKDEITRTRISQRLNLWQEVLVPKWHHAFSQLVADSRFAVLGVVLLAALSQTCQILGITEAFEDLGQAEAEKAIEKFGQEYWVDGFQAAGRGSDGEDLGVVVAREEEVNEAASPGEVSEKTPPAVKPNRGVGSESSLKRTGAAEKLPGGVKKKTRGR
ncbi:RNase MRP subunit [Saxophila tyrrhenica]|uniref:RNase MRP subunit n=1 Tax=Saxophila tyrrhenica TaxID=1690608 RepID=A0AAV9P534_9PEZI|nr:RNase MRP subunit [Saxophila tyrrhenica]